MLFCRHYSILIALFTEHAELCARRRCLGPRALDAVFWVTPMDPGRANQYQTSECMEEASVTRNELGPAVPPAASGTVPRSTSAAVAPGCGVDQCGRCCCGHTASTAIQPTSITPTPLSSPSIFFFPLFRLHYHASRISKPLSDKHNAWVQPPLLACEHRQRRREGRMHACMHACTPACFLPGLSACSVPPPHTHKHMRTCPHTHTTTPTRLSGSPPAQSPPSGTRRSSPPPPPAYTHGYPPPPRHTHLAERARRLRWVLRQERAVDCCVELGGIGKRGGGAARRLACRALRRQPAVCSERAPAHVAAQRRL
eukprot:356948-Chlamydomonas_euryale.AAC.1